MKNTSLLRVVLLLAAVVPSFAAVADQAVGSSVTFSVTIASGSQPFTYQWRKAPSALAVPVPIPGATSASYTIPAVAVSDAGVYSVVVTNKAGSGTSDNGTFTITAPPNGVTVQIATP